MSTRPHLAILQKWWLLALLFLIPLSLQYLVTTPVAISSLNVLSIGFIGLGTLNLLTGAVPFRPITHRPYLWVLFFLVLALAYALLFTSPLRNAVGLWTSRLSQPLLVGFFAYQLLANRLLTVAHAVRALFYSLVPLLVLAGMQLTGFLPYADAGRITASYFFPNTFARYVGVVLLVSLPWILFSLQRGKRAHLGLWFLGCVLLLSSKSYGGTLAFLSGLTAIVLILPAPFVSLKRFVLSGLVILLVVVGLNVTKLPKWQTSITSSRESRLEYWDIALHVIRDNFWTGIGIKTWETDYVRLIETYRTEAPINWQSPQPHNVYLDAFVKAGLPGFFAILAFLLWPVVEGFAYAKSYSAKDPTWWYGLSLFGLGCALLTFGLIDDPLWSDDVMPLFAILFGFLAYVVTKKTKA